MHAEPSLAAPDYAEPASPPAPTAPPHADLAPPSGTTDAYFALAACVSAAGGLGAMAAFYKQSGGWPIYLAITAVSLTSVILGIRALGRADGGKGKFSAVLAAIVGVGPVAAGAMMFAFGAIAALLSTVAFSRGRQLRKRGRVLLPKVIAGAEWAAPSQALAIDPEIRESLADQWRENGRTEHASVAAFARLTLDLIALGAPPHLIQAANRDAIDEVGHAELCFSLARAIDGREASPGPFGEAKDARTLPNNRTLALAALAVDSLVDGALHEGLSARVVAKLARRSEEPRIADLLRTIARDEGRHAAHGWDVVKWCLAEGGAPVMAALEGAVHALPRGMKSSLPAEAEAGGWERWGIMGRALESTEYVAALVDIEARIAALKPRAAAKRAA